MSTTDSDSQHRLNDSQYRPLLDYISPHDRNMRRLLDTVAYTTSSTRINNGSDYVKRKNLAKTTPLDLSTYENVGEPETTNKNNLVEVVPGSGLYLDSTIGCSTGEFNPVQPPTDCRYC